MTSLSSEILERRATIIGVGLIGGSIGLALRQNGWHVSGVDTDPVAISQALKNGIIDVEGDDSNSTFIVIAVPSNQVAMVALDALQRHTDPSLIVTDMAGVKSSICSSVGDPRFIGGHPMAGSEQIGNTGSRSDLFVGATWVLTPHESTPPETYVRCVSILHEIGAHTLALSPEDHDRLVALVSHVPHLVAASLMNEASLAAQSDGALLQLAAGGFRDMTRVAAGDPGIWPDLVIENHKAISDGLTHLIERLSNLRDDVDKQRKSNLSEVLSTASLARNALPGGTINRERLTQVRLPVPDQPGVLSSVTSTASDLGVSVVDIEIAHSIEGDRGVLILVVETKHAQRFVEALNQRGFSSSTLEL